jgi:potassium efflux system protein
MFRTIAILVFSAILIAAPSHAQEPATANVAPEPKPEVQTDSATEISVRANRVSADLSAMLDALQASSSEIDKIPEKTDTLRLDLEKHLESVDRDEILTLRSTDAEILAQSLNRMNRQLTDWQNELQQRADYLDNQKQLNKAELEYFQDISRSGESEDLPDALIERSVSIIKELNTLRPLLLDRLNLVINNLTEISKLKQQIREYLLLIDTSAEQRSKSLLALEYPPIWKIPAAETGPIERLIIELRSRSDAAMEFIKANAPESISLLLILAIMLIFSGFSYQSMDTLPELPGAMINVRARPFSVIFLLWLLLGPELILPQLSGGLTTLRILIGVFALWRLLPAILPASERTIIPALLMLAGSIVIIDFWPPEESLGRAALIFISVVGIILFHRFGRSLKMSDQSHDLWWAAGRILTVAAPILLGITILGAIFGAVTLAVQLSFGLFLLFISILALMVVEISLNAIFELFAAGYGKRWLRFIRNHPKEVQRRVASLFRFAMLVLLIIFIPRNFPLTQFIFDWLGGMLATEFSLGSVVVSLDNIFALIIGIVIAISLSRFIRLLLDEDIFPRLPVAAGAASAASRLIYYALVTGGILFALAASGVELSNLTLLISALGVGIGFGLQGIVNNFVSGLVLAFERPFQVGDIIAVGQLTGRVRQIGLRASRVRTFEGAEVIVPNADLIAGEVINWTLSDRMRRVEVTVGVAYGSDTTQVRELLLKVADENEQVAKNPEPTALFLGFDDSAMRFALRIWIAEAGDWPEISSDIYEAVNTELKAADIEIPFPQRTVHLDKGE